MELDAIGPDRGIENLSLSGSWVGGAHGKIQYGSEEKNLALVGTTVHWCSNYDLTFIIELKMNILKPETRQYLGYGAGIGDLYDTVENV